MILCADNVIMKCGLWTQRVAHYQVDLIKSRFYTYPSVVLSYKLNRAFPGSFDCVFDCSCCLFGPGRMNKKPKWYKTNIKQYQNCSEDINMEMEKTGQLHCWRHEWKRKMGQTACDWRDCGFAFIIKSGGMTIESPFVSADAESCASYQHGICMRPSFVIATLPRLALSCSVLLSLLAGNVLST